MIFQGFVFQDVIIYLVVGENKLDGFIFVIKCDFQDQLIVIFFFNQKKYIGKFLKVNFEEYMDFDGLEMQFYFGGSFVE